MAFKRIDINILTDLHVFRITENRRRVWAIGQILFIFEILEFTYRTPEHGEYGHSSSETRNPGDRFRKQHGDFIKNGCNKFG
jgi:hypothetical protein